MSSQEQSSASVYTATQDSKSTTEAEYFSLLATKIRFSHTNSNSTFPINCCHIGTVSDILIVNVEMATEKLKQLIEEVKILDQTPLDQQLPEELLKNMKPRKRSSNKKPKVFSNYTLAVSNQPTEIG